MSGGVAGEERRLSPLCRFYTQIDLGFTRKAVPGEGLAHLK
jgi:hypothetical protein